MTRAAGARVKAVGLKANTANNGRTGEVLCYDRSALRYRVRLDAAGDDVPVSCLVVEGSFTPS